MVEKKVSLKKKRHSKYRPIRFLMLFLAFLLIAITPYLNSKLHFNFVQGWFQSLSIGKLWFVSPLEGLESILTSRLLYGPLLVGMAIPVIIALLLGRVFCSWICPISFLSELIDRIILKIKGERHRKGANPLPRALIWYALIGEILLALVIGAPIFVFLSPPGLVGREIMVATIFHTLAIEGVVVIIVLLMHLFQKRFFCKYLCPLGGLLALLGIKRRLVIQKEEDLCVSCGICKKACPFTLDPEKGQSLSPYCWNCGECIDSCKTGALNFKWKSL